MKLQNSRALFACLILVALATSSGTAAASRPVLLTSARELQQARPMAMNAPIFLSEDAPAPRGQQSAGRPQAASIPRFNNARNSNNRGLLQNPGTFGSNWNAQGMRNPGNGWANGWANTNRPVGNGWGSRQAATGWGSSQGWGGNSIAGLKGNRQRLESLYGGSRNSYAGISAQPIAATGAAGTLAQGIRRRGNAKAAAQSLAQAYGSGQADAAATALAASATDNSLAAADSTAVAETVAEATVIAPKAAPALLSKSASTAVSRGQTKGFARTMANAFGVAKQRQYVPQFTVAIADAIATGGAPTRYAYGQAMAAAIAQGGDSSAAVAEATAEAFCKGGDVASSWASAYAIALSQDSRGCLVLNQAKALAQARCGNGASEAFSKADAASTVLGFCGLLDMIPGGIDMGWSGSNSGSNSIGGGVGSSSGTGTTSGAYGGLLSGSGN